MRFKNFEEKSEKKSSKKTISTSGGLELLLMILESDTRRWGSEGEWIMRSHVDWGGERNILYKGVETS